MPSTTWRTTTTRTAKLDQEGYGGTWIAVETPAGREVARCKTGGPAVSGAARKRLPAMATTRLTAEVGFAASVETGPSRESGTVQSAVAIRAP